MKCNKENMLLYAVTDRKWTGTKTLTEQTEDALKGGVTCVQLREKNLDSDTFLEEAIAMRKLCHSYGAVFIVNDNVDIAIQSKADGVHIGQDDMELNEVRKLVGDDMIIGVSAHSVREATEAEKAGADYLGVGAAFATDTKSDANTISHETIKAICDAVNIPVVAIGGISKENISELKGTGVDGVALVSAVYGADDIEAECRTLRNLSQKMTGTMNTALTIAGSDSSGGAGIQADIKTMSANGVYAMSAITALTAQNTMGVKSILEVTPQFLSEQLDCVFTDIYPDAVKIGMVSSSALIKVIADKLNEYNAENIVVDPVMVATSGSKLIADEAIETLKKELLPIAKVVTPNIFEAEILADMKIENAKDMETAAKRIYERYGCAVLLKGGHSINDANDLLYTIDECRWYMGNRIDNPNTHGTGCTLSSAIASNLAKRIPLERAVENAKEYISGALMYGLDLGRGSGPLNHMWVL